MFVDVDSWDVSPDHGSEKNDVYFRCRFASSGSLEWWESIPSPNVLVSTKPTAILEESFLDVPGGFDAWVR